MNSSSGGVERAPRSDMVSRTVSGCGMLMISSAHCRGGQPCHANCESLRQLTGLLVVKEATIDAAWYLITPIKDHILFCVLIVITCITVITSLQTTFSATLISRLHRRL